jgi:Predicted acetyltransferase
MTDGSVTFDLATPGEVETIAAWAAAEGWNPGPADAALFRLADPEGFLVAREGGEMVASISLVRAGPAFAFLGFYIVRPDRRGRGIGKALWDVALARNGTATVGLDGVLAQQANYAKSGFAFAHRNIRFAGRPDIAPPDDPRLRAPATEADVAAILAYDAPLFPGPRTPFLRAWLAGPGPGPGPGHGTGTGPGHVARMLVEDGAVRGYGVVRPCAEGHKIGPLFADGPAEADLLFRALAAAVATTGADGPVILDAPEPNVAATALAARHGLVPVFETARMYRGPAPDLDLSRIFGITTFELG